MKNKLIDIEFDEVIELESPVEVVEEYLDVDNSLVEMERNRDLIRMEMNIVEYPIFSKNKRLKKNQIMKYHFKTDGSAYIEVTPLVNRTIPGEFEERVFISLTKIMRDNGYGRTFYTTPTEIIRNLGEDFDKVPSVYYKKVKEALNKMNESNYKFKNSLYSNEYKKTLEDEIKTNIMNIRIISKIDASHNEKELFEDGRIKEIYKISFSDYFYENIVRKGYLVFNSEELLKIKDAVTRSVYTQITKWRNNKLYLKRPAFYIARRIPLKWDKKNLARTVKRMEESCILLKEMGFLKDYRVIKNKKWEQAEFEFYFDEEHNRIQQENFFKEREDFRIAYVEEKDLKDDELKGKETKSSEEIESKINIILDILPPKAKSLKTMRSSILQAINNYEFEYIKYTAEYTSLYCKKSIKKYFEDALLNNWAEEYMNNKKTKEEIKVKESSRQEKTQLTLTQSYEEKEKNSKDMEKLWQSYEEMSPESKNQIEERAYLKFLEEIGQNDTALNKKIFSKGERTHILNILREEPQQYEEKITKVNEEKLPIENEDINVGNESKVEECYERQEIYESMSMFLFDVMNALEKFEIQDYQKILQIIPLLNEFSGTLNNIKINLKYNPEGKSIIEIKPH